MTKLTWVVINVTLEQKGNLEPLVLVDYTPTTSAGRSSMEVKSQAKEYKDAKSKAGAD